MSVTFDLANIPEHQNEPRMHHAMGGFLAVPSVGMRLAPEVLLLELFRQVFFRGCESDTKIAAPLSPKQTGPDGSLLYSDAEQAVIVSLRGRRKLTKQHKESTFYAPAYKQLARHAWLSSKREKIIERLLFEGAISQSLWAQGATEQAKQAQTTCCQRLATALVGNRKADPETHLLCDDVLARAINVVPSEEDLALGRDAMMQMTSGVDHAVANQADPLPDRIRLDLEAICDLEPRVARLLWLNVLMTFLRFALPLWLLAQMRMTELLHKWLLQALAGMPCPAEPELQQALLSRHKQLLSPTLTATGELFERISTYMKCRVELNILLHCLEALRPVEIGGKKVVFQQATSRGRIRLSDLLGVAAGARSDLQSARDYGDAPSPAVFVKRAARRFAAWRDPLDAGQGHNIDEFFRVLYRAETGDDLGGYLLRRQGRGDTKGFQVFPGSLLLQVMCQLAIHEKTRLGSGRGGGRLTLQDIENHFRHYGVDFSVAADARPLILESLQDLGLLHGSPDAGSSVAVSHPFSF